MPAAAAMWDRLRSTTTATEMLPQPLLMATHNKKHARPGRGNLKGDSSSFNRLDIDPDKQFWQDNFDHALGVSGATFRYEVVRGRTVPQPQAGGPSPASTDAVDNVHSKHEDNGVIIEQLASAPAVRPPPRNPLRRLRSEQAWRPASSIYDNDNDSSPAILLPSESDTMDFRPAPEMVSPPSSPEMGPSRRQPAPGDVSPIEDEPSVSQKSKIPRPRHFTSSEPQREQHRSSLPSMTREQRPQAAPSSRDGRHTPTGHGFIPRSDAMRLNAPSPIGARPGAESPFAGSDDGGVPFGSTTTISGPQVHRSTNNASPSFGQRVRQFGGRGKPEPVESRPAWNGASGRTTTVAPVRDDPAARRVKAPPKEKKRMARGRGDSGNGGGTSNDPRAAVSPVTSETRTGAAATVRRLLPSRPNHKTQQIANEPTPPESTTQTPLRAPAYPSPPRSASPISPPQTSLQQFGSSPVNLPHVAPVQTSNLDKAIKRKPPPTTHLNPEPASSHKPQPSTSSSIYSSHPLPGQAAASSSPVAANTQSPSALRSDDGWVQPPSRFSISTFATSAPGTPRMSKEENRPPMPDLPPQATSMMDRRRPISSAGSPAASPTSPIIISMDSPNGLGKDNKTHGNISAMMAQHRKSATVDSTGRPLSILSTSKALPPVPPELLSAHDRVANLNAKLENLAHRRLNINRSIKQMTELMPTDNLMASAEVLQKRELEKRKVEGLKEELAEVQQDEYELGLKLHRAYKRLDKESELEPSGLWVSRVAS